MFIVNEDVIFDETESKIYDEINHLRSCLEKKNTKGKGKKSRQSFWFEKDCFFKKHSFITKFFRVF
jgi:hypothetical protein